MKIVISPSKTATYQRHPLLEGHEILFPKETKKLVSVIRKYNMKELGKALSIKGDLLTKPYHQYKDFHKSPSYHAFPSFDGLVYKQLSVSTYHPQHWAYITSNVRVLDALYGVLHPDTLIKPYRLDMKAKLGFNLYQYWQINDFFKGETILNLASNEFAEMLRIPVITVQFLEQEGTTYRNVATFAKMARGKLLDYLILHQITSIDDVLLWNEEGYQYDPMQSNDQTITFVRQKH